jgi:uncharacterized protein YfaS (alpha-2-macroglobulin family)
MRSMKVIWILLIAASFFVTACGSPSSGATGATGPAGGGDVATSPAQSTSAFVTSELTVTPDSANPGDRVMVGVTVANAGTQPGTYTVTVKDHDGTVLGTKDVTLDGGAKQDVTLHISINTAGTHMVMVDNLWHNLVISKAAAAPAGATVPAQTTQAPPPAAAGGFVITGLGVDPDMPDVGENIIISFNLANNSGKADTYHAEVKIDGTTVATKDITLAAGASQLVNISTKAPTKEGKFTVTVGDKSTPITVMMM